MPVNRADRYCATKGCHNLLTQGRNRKYCLECRPSVATQAVAEFFEQQRAAPEPKLVKVYREQLRAAGREETPDGVHALHLAYMLAVGGHSASGAASLSRELRATMEIALKGAAAQEDTLDALSARRQKKLEGGDDDAAEAPIAPRSAVS